MNASKKDKDDECALEYKKRWWMIALIKGKMTNEYFNKRKDDEWVL